MVARLARRRLRAKLWQGARKCWPQQECDPTPHRTLDLDQCDHFQQQFARRRRRFLVIAARLSQRGMIQAARIILDVVNGWREDEVDMCKQAKIVVATFF